MKHVMPHDLSPALARKVAERAFASYREKYERYDPRLEWLNENTARASFSAKGIQLHGTIELLPNAISFDLEVPFVLRVFKSKAVQIVERELEYWRAKAKAGELD